MAMEMRALGGNGPLVAATWELGGEEVRLDGVSAWPLPYYPFWHHNCNDSRACATSTLSRTSTGAAVTHGLVCSVNASEFWTLSEEERRKIANVMVARVEGRIPTVVGVASGSADVGLARAAEEVGADAVIAMPPTGRSAPPNVISRYYGALSAVASIPIFVQSHDAPGGTRMSAAFVSELVNEIEHVEFIKEETVPPQHAISDEIRVCGDHLRGVMGGIAGRYLFQEHARGSCGRMPACEMTDVHVRIWESLDTGDEAQSLSENDRR